MFNLKGAKILPKSGAIVVFKDGFSPLLLLEVLSEFKKNLGVFFINMDYSISVGFGEQSRLDYNDKLKIVKYINDNLPQ